MSMSSHKTPISLYTLFLLTVLVLGFYVPANASQRRIHVTDDLNDIVDDEEDEEWKQWGSKKSRSQEEKFDPPDFSNMELSEIQEEMMKRHVGPTFGFVKLRLGVPHTKFFFDLFDDAMLPLLLSLLTDSLDLYLPKNMNGLKLVIAFVTSGAWNIGYKAWGSLLGQQLLERDIMVACIDYRVHLMGQSAGAHIAACALVEQAIKEFGGGENISWSVSQIKAYFGLFGGYNLLKLIDHFHSRGLYRSIFSSSS